MRFERDYRCVWAATERGSGYGTHTKCIARWIAINTLFLEIEATKCKQDRRQHSLIVLLEMGQETDEEEADAMETDDVSDDSVFGDDANLSKKED